MPYLQGQDVHSRCAVEAGVRDLLPGAKGHADYRNAATGRRHRAGDAAPPAATVPP